VGLVVVLDTHIESQAPLRLQICCLNLIVKRSELVRGIIIGEVRCKLLLKHGKAHLRFCVKSSLV